MSESELFDAIGAAGVVPVITIDDAASAVPLANALADGGLPFAEVTLRTDAGLDAIDAIAAGVDDVVVGAGSVMTRTDAEAAIDAGAAFVVSPGFDEGVVEASLARGVPVLPGVATATELMTARRSGVDVVKLFPAEAIGGIAMLSALSAVWPHVRLVPTGGISPANVADYLNHRAVLAVGGSWMVPRESIGAHDWAGITELARATVDLVTSARGAR